MVKNLPFSDAFMGGMLNYFLMLSLIIYIIYWGIKICQRIKIPLYRYFEKLLYLCLYRAQYHLKYLQNELFSNKLFWFEESPSGTQVIVLCILLRSEWGSIQKLYIIR